jgi:hypothetical protein
MMGRTYAEVFPEPVFDRADGFVRFCIEQGH